MGCASSSTGNENTLKASQVQTAQHPIKQQSSIENADGTRSTANHGTSQENLENLSLSKNGSESRGTGHCEMRQQNVQHSPVDIDHAGGLVAENDRILEEDSHHRKTQDVREDDVMSNDKFVVEDVPDGDNSVAFISQEKMDELDLFRGDTVLLKSLQQTETCCVIMMNDTLTDDKIQMNRCLRNNLGVKIGDVISLQKFENVPMAERVYILPIEDTTKFPGDLFRNVLQRYFNERYRPIRKGDIFLVRDGPDGDVEFKVIDTEPSPYCIVSDSTAIHCEGDPVKREHIQSYPANKTENLEALVARVETAKEQLREEMEAILEKSGKSDQDKMVPEIPSVTMEQIGGLEIAKKELIEQIMFPLEQQGLVEKFGMKVSYNLLHGPPGCGKTMLAKAIANECSCVFLSAKATPGKYHPYTDELREAFDKARKCTPCVLFLDLTEMEKSENKGNSGSDYRMYLINTLLSELDGLGVNNSNLFVIGAVTSKMGIDPSLLRPGRLSHLIAVPLPDEEARARILKVNIGHSVEVMEEDLDYVAKETRGYTGRDLTDICTKAVKLNSSKDGLVKISRSDFEEVIRSTTKTLSEEEVEYYEKVAKESDNFMFGMPRFPKPGERQGGYKMGQFMDEGEEVLYGNNKTASQNGQDYKFDEDDDDDLYS